MLARQIAAPTRSFFLFGPRGTGKTTWIHEEFPQAATYDLLRASESLRLHRDPSAFARECEDLPARSWVVIDEVQKAPLLLDEVQRLMGERQLRFVLSGSSARKLRRGGANLLAGRAVTRQMFPFVSSELDSRRSLDETLRHGMLPMAVGSEKPDAFLRSYVDTYLSEEIKAEALVRQIGGFARFLEVAARINGQTVNVSGIARDAQVARPTVQDYLSILIDTLIATWLPAYRSKRAVKQVAHPKLFFFDTGVVRHLAGTGHLDIHPEERGALFETYLMHEVRAWLSYRELGYPMFYWGTHHGTEVDLLVESPKGLFAIEMKSGTRWDPRAARGLQTLREHARGAKVVALGVYAGERRLVADGVTVWPWQEFLSRLWAGELIR